VQVFGIEAQFFENQVDAGLTLFVRAVSRHMSMLASHNCLQDSDFGYRLSLLHEYRTMYAIIQTSGRQVKVTPGGFVKLDGTAGEPGAELTLGQVLLVETDGGDIVAGAPFVANATVVAVVDGEARGPKIRVFKKKRRKGMRRTKGHRATFTRVRIKDILL
jgi:large subunit ribosomal protein L21